MTGIIGAIGLAALARFPLWIFHPGQSWARSLCAVITVAGIVGGTACAVSALRAENAQQSILQIQPFSVMLMATICVCFTWIGIESGCYCLRMKRRLGLAQPETTHRFLLWAIASGCTVVALGTNVVLAASGIATLSIVATTIIAYGSLVSFTSW